MTPLVFTLQIMDDFLEGFRSVSDQVIIQFLGGLIPTIYTLVIIIGVLLAVFKILRYAKSKTDFQGTGERIGEFWINIHGYARLKGNLSRDETFLRRDDLDELAKSETLKIIPEKIRELIEKDIIHVYDYKVTENSEPPDVKGQVKRTKLIVSDDLTRVATQDRKGTRSIDSIWQKKYPKSVNVVGEKILLKNEDGNIDEYWIVAVEPIPKGFKEYRKEFGFPVGSIESMQFVQEVKFLKGGEELTVAVSYMKTVTEAEKQIRIYKEEKQQMQLQLDRSKDENAALNARVNRLKHMLTQKVFVKFGIPETPIRRITEWGWIIGSIFGGAFGFGVIPEIPSLEDFPPWGGVALVVVIVIVAKDYHNKKMREQAVAKMEQEQTSET